MRVEELADDAKPSSFTAPRYRVFFWERAVPHRSDSMWRWEGWGLSEVDVDEVLVWAEERRRSRPMSIWAVVSWVNEHGELIDDHIRLFGSDPVNTDWPDWARQVAV